MLREPTAGSGKPRRGHKASKQPGSRPRKKQAREEPSRDRPQGPRGSGSAPRLPSWGCAELHLQLQQAVLGLRARVVVLEGHERGHQSELGFEQQNRFRNLRETQGIEKKAFRARADATQSTRQGGTEPGTTRFRDGRRTAGPPAPRRGPGAPTAQPRPRGARPRKRANLARGKICDFCPELGFEQRNRFRSLRDTRRIEKKVLRKPPAARPVVGQTFKYIY